MSEQSNVVSPWGYLTKEPMVNDDLVKCLEELMEMAKSGEIIALAGAIAYKDGLASFRIAGVLPGYGILGALTVVQKRAAAIVDGDD